MKIILFICLFSSSIVFFKTPFEFYFHYIIFIVMLPFFLFKYGTPKFLIQILFVPLIIGIIHIGLNNNEVFDFIKIIGGLFISILFFYYLINHLDFKITSLFKLYVRFCFLLVVIGLIQLFSFYIGFTIGYDYSWIFNKWGLVEGGLLGIRVNSILAEPSQLAIVISPAAYISIRNILHKENYIINKIQSILVLFVLICTTSTIGYFGILLALILVTESYRLRYFVIGIIFSIILYQLAYRNIDDFKSRVDSAIGLWLLEDFSIKNTNNSSFVLFNSIHIAKESLKEYPLFGTGLGSHEKTFNKHTLTGKIIKYDFEFNKKDGNSLLIRLIVETGIIGVFFVFILIFRCLLWKVKHNDTIENVIISQALFIILTISLIRQGNYMLNGLPFLFMLYYYNYQKVVK